MAKLQDHHVLFMFFYSGQLVKSDGIPVAGQFEIQPGRVVSASIKPDGVNDDRASVVFEFLRETTGRPGKAPRVHPRDDAP